ncbi:MAG: hypothetical protein EPO28_06835 [Saprospiraceae bacterium]|nr:MAG: hypothetical protein EPO28_06835 [Saprospiraceae bacterium]
MKSRSASSTAPKLAKKGRVIAIQHPSLNGASAYSKALHSWHSSASYQKSLRQISRFRIAWLHHKHPEWSLPEITADMVKWYAKDMPTAARTAMKKFIKEQWVLKAYEEINGASLDALFATNTEA